MKVLLIIFAVLCIIALVPVGASAVYDKDGVEVSVIAAFFKIRVYPLKKKKKVIKKKEKKPKKEEEPKEEEEKGGPVMGFREILPIALKAGSRFKRSLTINRLVIHYTAASKDAFTAAMEYGASWAFIGMITPAIENNFKVKQRDLQAFADFATEKPAIYASAALTIRIWQITYIAVGFAWSFIKLYIKNKRQGDATPPKERKAKS